jgi:hypothetical protein
MFRKVLTWMFVEELKFAGTMFKRFHKTRALGVALCHPVVLDYARRMQKNISLLPTFPGTKQYNHNLKYTLAFCEKLEEVYKNYKPIFR